MFIFSSCIGSNQSLGFTSILSSATATSRQFLVGTAFKSTKKQRETLLFKDLKHKGISGGCFITFDETLYVIFMKLILESFGLRSYGFESSAFLSSNHILKGACFRSRQPYLNSLDGSGWRNCLLIITHILFCST